MSIVLVFGGTVETGDDLGKCQMRPPNWTDPDAYEIFMGRWSELLAKPFLAFAGVAPNGRVLDVACGTGVLTKALADAGAHVIGVDASEGYLEGAHRRRSHPNITYELGDIRQMRFDDNSFDAAVSTLALDVLPEIEQVVAEMKRVTRPGGVVASGVPQFFGGTPASDLVNHTGAVLDAGMNEMRSFQKGRPLFWANGQAGLWRKMGLTGGQGRLASLFMELSDEVRGAIEQHVRDGYLVGLPDGPRSFPMMFRVVRGVVPG